MKNTLIYYIAILIPVPLLIWLALTNLSTWFVICLILYALIYRTVTDGYRLIKKGVLEKKDLWKLLVPFYGRTKYFKELYWE